MKELPAQLAKYVDEIARSGKSIYDHGGRSGRKLWIPSEALEDILQRRLSDISLAGLPLRTRSKVLKGYFQS